MARKNRLTFTISRTLLASGLVAGLAGACDERDVTVNPAIDVEDSDTASDAADTTRPDSSDPDSGWFDEYEVTVNPDPCVWDYDEDGYTQCGPDCNDQDPSIHRGAEEICDGQDNDCDHQIDELDAFDTDGDGYPTRGLEGCEPPPELDCDDTEPDVHPGAAERCNGIDDDCNGSVDEPDALTTETAPGWTFCYGACTGLADDTTHCGACHAACADFESCVEGRCCTASGVTSTDPAACCHGDADGDGVCDEPVASCLVAGTLCTLTRSETPCCHDALCQDVGQAAPQGQGVCCLPDGAAWAEAAGGGDACCSKDLDGDGLCGPA